MTHWLSRTIGAVLISAAATIAVPAQACSCIPPENLERFSRVALAKANLVAELEIGRLLLSEQRYCTAIGQARFWFRSGSKVDRDYAARADRIIKGRVSGPIRLRDSLLQSVGGACTTTTSSCDVGIRRGLKTGPLLLRRVAPGVFQTFDVCAQDSFAEWYARRRAARRSKP